MNISQLISIALFTVAAVITILAWNDRLSGGNAAINEAFEDAGTMKDIDKNDPTLKAIEELASSGTVSETQASNAYRTLLKFIQQDFARGALFVEDMTRRFYGEDKEMRQFQKDLDVSTLLDNYRSPLQRVR
jgi:hypothetical protein